jgi:hypothetical protein
MSFLGFVVTAFSSFHPFSMRHLIADGCMFNRLAQSVRCSVSPQAVINLVESRLMACSLGEAHTQLDGV